MNQEMPCYVPDPWYHWHRFPVLPKLSVRSADEQNTGQFYFSWLVFRSWTMDSTDFQVEARLDDMDFCVRGMIPYLIFGIWIPVFPMSFHQKLWRRSRMMKKFHAQAKAERRRQKVTK